MNNPNEEHAIAIDYDELTREQAIALLKAHRWQMEARAACGAALVRDFGETRLRPSHRRIIATYMAASEEVRGYFINEALKVTGNAPTMN